MKPAKAILILTSLLFLAWGDVSLLAAQNNQVKVFVFGGQSNCTGAGGRVARHLVDNQAWRSPYVFKMIRNVRLPKNNPTYDRNWLKRSFYTPQDLDGDGELDYETGTRLSHLMYPFHTLFHPNNSSRLLHNYLEEFDCAVHPPTWDSGCAKYPGAFDDNHANNLGFDGFIGSEVSFAKSMRLEHPNHDIAIVKVSAGSSSIANWEPARRLWKPSPQGMTQHQARLHFSRDGGPATHDYLLFREHLAPAVKQTLMTLANQYDQVELAGFVWIQGESDLRHLDPTRRTRGYVNQKAIDYQRILYRMIAYLRREHNRQMPFVIARTTGNPQTDWNGTLKSERLITLQAAQMRVADDDPKGKGTWIDLDDLTMIGEFDEPESNDFHHLDTRSLQLLGHRVYQGFTKISDDGS
jgi:hypothetical protein